MFLDKTLYRAYAAAISDFAQPVVAYRRIADSGTQTSFQDLCITGKNSFFDLLAGSSVGLKRETILFQRSFALEMPVIRDSSARFIFEYENESPCLCFISSMACVIVNL